MGMHFEHCDLYWSVSELLRVHLSIVTYITLTLPLELCFGRILPFWKAPIEGNFKK